MRSLALVGLALALAGNACSSNSCVSTTQTVTGPNVAAPGSSPAAPGACAPAARVDASALGGGVVRVGSEERLDATAYTADGQEIVGACAAAKVVTWTPFTGPCEYTTSPSGFNPHFRGVAQGSCATAVEVDGQSAAVSIRVVQ